MTVEELESALFTVWLGYVEQPDTTVTTPAFLRWLRESEPLLAKAYDAADFYQHIDGAVSRWTRIHVSRPGLN